MSAATLPDPHDRRIASRATGLLATFNRLDALHAADVQVAQRLGHLVGEERDDVMLAVALAVRGARNGSVCVDLDTIATLPLEGEEQPPWPVDVAAWTAHCASGPLASEGLIHVEGSLLYLDRYHREEEQVAAALLARLAADPPAVDEPLLQAGLDRLYGDAAYVEQRWAVEASVRRWTTVLTGGPGTGKTTTVARLLMLLSEQHEQVTGRRPRVAMAAPTAKASVRLREAVAESASGLVTEAQGAGPQAVARARQDAGRLADVPSTTLHRLLGWKGSSTRFRHDRDNRLAHDIVVIDETSMLSLTHMARLLDALRPTTRLVLVGDADQLASVEAGAVLADLVEGLEHHRDTPVSRLLVTHRYGARIGALAAAIRAKDVDRVKELLSTGAADVDRPDPDDHSEVVWVDPDQPADVAAFRRSVLDAALRVRRAAERGDGPRAIAALESTRLLCAHRSGPEGVSGWNRVVERLLTEATGVAHYDEWYAGRPVMVTNNDYGLDLYNGDLGVTVRDAQGRLRVSVKGAAGQVRELATTRLVDVETVYATTVHKAQGSQAHEVAVVLPAQESRLLTRELFYTAITRAQTVVTVHGSLDVVALAVTQEVQRASGLATRLGRAAGR